MAETITVTIERSDPDATQSFEVSTHPRQTVLDALFTIQNELDPTLAFRCACRVGMCGSCGMVINGREGLACRTPIRKLGRRVHVAPMRHQPVVRDLVVDMAPFFGAYRAITPAMQARAEVSDPVVMPPASGLRESIDLGLECITCGLCYSACDMVRLTGGRFLGPAALNRAYNLVADLRDDAAAKRMAMVSDPVAGVWSCHNHLSCVEVCPKDIAPTRAIAALKRRLVRRAGSGRAARPIPTQYRWPSATSSEVGAAAKEASS